MDFQNFIFTFQASPTPAGAGAATWTGLMAPVTPSHAAAVAEASGGHADAQARYRARNLETERTKGRDRMRRLRQKAVSQGLEMNASQKLRASKSFAAFRERVRTYPLWITTDDDQPDDYAEYKRFMDRMVHGPPGKLDDEEVDFLYRHVTPSPRTTFAAFREFVHENIFWVHIDNNDPEDLEAYEQFIENNAPRTFLEMADDDLEFLFRHIVPEPENLDGDEGAEKQREIEERRAQARERMAKRRAAIKDLPPEVQQELTEKARASRAKYRAQKNKAAA
ncbi:hypothetical protein B0H11DRAFT_1933770 [Mycena galericulata]|nr:hypothetical protein B0H11DRAFT_1933770 [Mycena galericulata]